MPALGQSVVQGGSSVTQPTLTSNTTNATTAFVNNSIIRSHATQKIVSTGGVYNLASVGTGLQVVVLASGGVVTSILTLVSGGTGYLNGDVLRLVGGNLDAVVRITNAVGGVVQSGGVGIQYGGTGYTTGLQLTGMDPPVDSYNIVTITGVLASGMTVIVPASTNLLTSRQFVVNNNTTGAFTVSYFMSNGAGGTIGTGVVVPQGTANSCATELQTDGVTDVWLAASPVCGPDMLFQSVTANLPTCNAGSKGLLGAVSDALAPTYNAVLAGSGAVSVPVYCNGTAWTTH